MSAAVAGTYVRFRPTRSYTNPRDVTAWLTAALTVSTVLSCSSWIKIRPQGTPAQRRCTVNAGELASTREEPRFTQSPCDG